MASRHAAVAVILAVAGCAAPAQRQTAEPTTPAETTPAPPVPPQRAALAPGGHPYLGDLVGRMMQNFRPPRLDGRVEAWGCVRVDAGGEIVDYLLDPEHRSGHARFDAAVEKSLILSKQLHGDPVPEELKPILLGKYVCATFRND